MQNFELELYLNELLAVARYRDYCPNGLQVEGRREIRRLVTGVTASLALLQAAQAWQADAILVHHGYFWKGEDARIRGQKHKRLQYLLQHDLNLFAYHLPLDGHAELGNNAQLGKRLDINPTGWFGEADLAWQGRLSQSCSLGELSDNITRVTGRTPLLLGDPTRQVQCVGWCTGGAQSYFESGIQAGIEVYISGEISEQTTHLSREMGVAYIAAGHHATERYGVQAVGAHLAQHFGLEHRFIDIPNPV